MPLTRAGSRTPKWSTAPAGFRSRLLVWPLRNPNPTASVSQNEMNVGGDQNSPQPQWQSSPRQRQNSAAWFVHSADPLRLKSVRNQLSSDHPRVATTRIATIGVPIATMAARIACQWVRNQSTTQSLRSNSGSLAIFAYSGQFERLTTRDLPGLPY